MRRTVRSNSQFIVLITLILPLSRVKFFTALSILSGIRNCLRERERERALLDKDRRGETKKERDS